MHRKPNCSAPNVNLFILFGTLWKTSTNNIAELENLAAQSAPVIRHTSNAEREWLTKLVRKHDDDYSAMARDAKINVWQKTPGELKRMVKKAGGAEKLLSAMDQD